MNWVDCILWELGRGHLKPRRRRGDVRFVPTLSATVVECLETRNLLAAFVVDTIVDELDGDQSAGDFSLREALQAANSTAGVDSISFDVSVFGTEQTIGLSLGELAVTDSVTITGPGKDLLTVSGLDRSRVFNIDDGDEGTDSSVQISNLTVANGLINGGDVGTTQGLDDDGGGILNLEDLALHDLVVRDNEANRSGGGIRTLGNLTLDRVEIVNNIAGNGGALESTTAELKIRDSSIRGNWANDVLRISGNTEIDRTAISGGNGVGVFGSGIVTIRDSEISDNATGVRVGPFLTAYLIRTLIYDNHTGGGIDNDGELFLTNSIVANNRSSVEGGGVTNGFRSTSSIYNSLIVNNQSDDGGGLYLVGSLGSAQVHNTIVLGNLNGPSTSPQTGSDIFDEAPAENVFSGSYNLIGDPDSAARFSHGIDGHIVGQDDGNGGRKIIDISAVLGELSSNGGFIDTFPLVAGNPAIDAGDPNFDASAFAPPLTTDARTDGFDRVIDGDGDGIARIDIGPFEAAKVGGIIVSESSGSTRVAEGGESDSISVALNRRPLRDVVVKIDHGTTSSITVTPQELTFTVEDWQQPQVVEFFGVSDDIVTGNQTFVVSLDVDAARSSPEFGTPNTNVEVLFLDNEVTLPGNVDGDDDFDASDSFLIQLVMLAASNDQIARSSGASLLSASEIRSQIQVLAQQADVDGNGVFNANDAFLIHLVKLAGTNSAIDLNKGGSQLSASEIRANIERLGAATTNTSANNAISMDVFRESVQPLSPDLPLQQLDLLYETDNEDPIFRPWASVISRTS